MIDNSPDTNPFKILLNVKNVRIMCNEEVLILRFCRFVLCVEISRSEISNCKFSSGFANLQFKISNALFSSSNPLKMQVFRTVQQSQVSMEILLKVSSLNSLHVNETTTKKVMRTLKYRSSLSYCD